MKEREVSIVSFDGRLTNWPTNAGTRTIGKLSSVLLATIDMASPDIWEVAFGPKDKTSRTTHVWVPDWDATMSMVNEASMESLCQPPHPRS